MTTDLTRRQFLARVAAGGLLAPALLAGCGGPSAPAAITELRAKRFRAAPDGRPREVMGFGGALPGPTIRAREGDTLRVKLINELGDVPTSAHWHGMHQPGTWQMDGVPDVSGPPVAPGSDFVYEFTATPAGTHWYHSHVGVQYGDGLFGPLIIEEATPIAEYDRDEVLMINDWFLQPGETLMENLLRGGMMKMPDKKDMKAKPDVGDVPFQSALINGKGRAPGDTTSPLTVVNVRKGERLRLRLINASSTYAMRFRIDGHALTVIASDGAPVKPVEVDSLTLAVGERYDVLLNADGQGAHWIRVGTLDGGEGRAILRYAGAAGDPAESPGNWGERRLALDQVRSRGLVKLSETAKEIPLILGGSMMPYRWSINEQFYPKADPIRLAKDEWVRMTFRNPTGMDHPFHLHGHYFYVLGKVGALNLDDPPQKDTVNVPAGGELVIQWQAKNPGRWFFHCHIEWHLEAGMARVIEIEPS